ncbi:MAG: transcriptional regulator SlyA [Methanobacterium sp. PtaB.Bin024]|nr:MAG: transcriptional regulator SlyA [Methanobacterium sp. PtaB.Bin024]
MSLNIPFKGIISIILRNHFVFMNKELKHLNLTEGQVPCLVALSKEEQLTQDDLARMFHIDKGTIARSIQKLEDKKMVRRVQDPVNRRRYILYLTEKGENIIPEILDAEKKWEDTIFKDFSEEERSFLVDGVESLAKNSLEISKRE